VLEPLLQGGAGALVQGNGDSHDVLRKSLIVTEVALVEGKATSVLDNNSSPVGAWLASDER
jgi:hypothetical protein